MTLLPARISIGTKLALRYALTLFGVLVIFAAGVSSLVERRINREAGLVLEVQLSDLTKDYAEHLEAGDPASVRSWFDRHAAAAVSSADRTLGLGIELLDADGGRLIAHGSLADVTVPIDRRLLARDRDRVLRAVNLGQEHAFLCMTQRVEAGFLRATVDTARFAKNAADIRRIFLWSVPVVMIVAFLAGWLLARGALRPLAEINEAAQRISADAAGTIPVTGSGDELDQLASTLNDMMDRVRAGVMRVRRFGDNVAHELRSPLNRLSHHLDLLERERGLGAEAGGALERARGEVATMAREIEAMLRLARFEEGLRPDQRQIVELSEAVELVASFFEAEADEGGSRLEASSEPGLRVSGDREWIQTALSNLVSNAVKYGAKGGVIRIRALRAGGNARIDVEDQGPGVPPERIDQVFERFGRSGPEGMASGFGLGLPIAREIARAHGGDVVITSAGPGTSIFTMTLPAVD